ncbi:leucine--tRNA ligase [Adhaeribacter aquaticus]|uniref:leucine--tRNA ligase n=1 Tax=Adhaeribacter aquaticus TaxID=299567 RepID=UPI000414D503|nr:leucine--tRNA ligase [Adhaeribacter aquaticus]
MSEYNFSVIEKKWQQYWADNQTFKTTTNQSKPKFYALDMFPYPSGAGLHVGHPLGYIASDIVARYKRLRGFNVLHPMGFDAFGLPAEQYAIQTGQHPAITTKQNIARYIEQLGSLGFSYDWSREVRTSDPEYYKWTQWIFIQLFNSWYNQESNKAEPVSTLIAKFEANGSAQVKAACDEDEITRFTAEEWKSFSEKQQSDILLQYRLAFLSEATVNWCPALGTVLANDEVKDGVSERGGYPVERKKMQQWSLRITAYAERLLNDIETVDWSEAIKEMQRNWIGKSMGAEVSFKVKDSERSLKVFTTRIDTLYGVTYLAIAPEHEWVPELTTTGQRATVEEYVSTAKNRSERDRMSDVKTISGAFTGSYVINPLSGEEIPIWVADYVLAGYGTGVVMAVPASDIRDFNFANHFNLPIVSVIEGTSTDEVYEAKEGKMINSGFLNGLEVKDAMKAAIARIEEMGIGKGKIMYRMRDAIFGRQRYWGEPIPIYYKDGVPNALPESELPLVLPEIDAYLPTETGEPPLGRATEWKYQNQYAYELSTMPGWAGSSWYYLRYMSPENTERFVTAEDEQYWKDVDLYIGGSEHATGHLLYSRFWYKFLFDLGLVSNAEPFHKLVNQGMIQGRSNFVYRINGTNKYVSHGLREQYDVTPLHVDVNIVENDVLDVEAFKTWRQENAEAEFVLEDGKYICGVEIEKMSKSKYNVVNPDDIIHRVGADTLRMYEMFLGPLEQFKPWNTNGIDGVHKFLKRFWKLFFDNNGNLVLSDEAPTPAELKTLHKTIKKVEEDLDRLSFNTSVSTFMIAVNELTTLKCNKKAILEPLTIILAPYAPHITEELWQVLGHQESITYAAFPAWKEEYLTESTFEYPVSVNGKMRGKITFPTDKPKEEIEKEVLSSGVIDKYLEGKTPKKIIVVPNKIVNVVV